MMKITNKLSGPVDKTKQVGSQPLVSIHNTLKKVTFEKMQEAMDNPAPWQSEAIWVYGLQPKPFHFTGAMANTLTKSVTRASHSLKICYKLINQHCSYLTFI